MAQVLQIPFFITEKILLLSFKNQEILLFKVKKVCFSNLTFEKLFFVKRPQLSNAPKIRTITPSS